MPESDSTVYNFKQRGSYIALGALIENIVIASAAQGFSATVSLLPEPHTRGVARIDFTPSVADTAEARELLASMSRRATNRKAYATAPLPPEEQRAVATLPAYLQNEGTLVLAPDRTTIDTIARAWSVNDRLIFNANRVHNSLFPHIVWSEAEEHEKKSGLYINTFELDPPARLLFPLFASWGFARFLGGLGFGSVVAAQNRARYAACGLVGGIWVSSITPEHLIGAGRILEQVWLRATRAGLALQPLMGMLYLEQYVREEPTHPFTAAQEKEIMRACDTLRTALPGKGSLVAAFRIGHASAPSAYSSKKQPTIEYGRT